MTLIKLDSGALINTDEIIVISTTDKLRFADDLNAVLPQTKWYALIGQNGSTVDLTEADRYRIVKEMKGERTIKLPKPYAWETKEGEILYTVEDKLDYEKRYHSSAWALWDFDTLRNAGLNVEVGE